MIFNKKVLNTTIACVLGVSAFNADAALVSLNITGSTSTTAGATTTNDSDASTTSMSAQSDAYEGYNNSYANSRGDDSGWFYSTADGGNNFLSQSIVTQSYNVTNDSNNEQFFDFSFEVMNGSISSSCGDSGYGYGENVGYGDGGNGCSVDDSAEAEYMAQILLNGSSIWDSQATITTDVNGSSLSQSGAAFNNANLSGNYLSWSKTSFNINLGLVAANASFILEYIVSTKVEGTLLDVSTGYTSAYAQFGDPNGFSSTNNTFNSRSTNVPAPAVLGLLGLGLVGLGMSRRKITTK